jgi:nucleoid-associated protein YejK
VKFIENVAAAVEALGVEKAGIVYGIAMTDWESDQKRDDFLRLVSGKSITGSF